MRIERLEIKGFGKLKNINMALGKGLNIIFGNNEAGKSTIQWFIKAMLFGLKGGKSSKDGVPPPLKRYKPWNENEYAGFLVYRLDDGQFYRIGRNFNNNSVRVFDDLFNDVTSSFDASKERGIHLAEKHLGLNEVCFDKTVFIRQMESKIGEDGSKELYNRIMNISETGFEDISFKKAQEALRAALKNYVGTEKTSTRPLDKVLNRLTELKNKKEELIKRRTSLFSIENELNCAIAVKSNLQDKKAFLEKLKELAELHIKAESNEKMRKQVQDTLNSINSDEDELKLILERAENFNKTKNEFSSFAAYDNEDIDEIDRNYLKLMDKINESRKLKIQIDNKERELNENRKQIESVLAFSSMGEGVENKAIEINKDIESLKKDYENSSLNLLNEKIGTLEKKGKAYKLYSIFSAFTALILLGIGILGIKGGYVATAIVLMLALFFLHHKAIDSKSLARLLDEKRVAFIKINSISEELSKKQDALASMFIKVGVRGIEDFLKLKAEYDAQSRLIAVLNGEINRLESERAVNVREITLLKGEIISKLIEAGIIDNEAVEFDEEHIKSFKNSVRRYKGIEPSIKYTAQRLEDVDRSLEKHYKNAAAICGSEFENKECLQKKIIMLQTEIIQLKKQSEELMDEINKYIDEGALARILPEIACDKEILQLSLSSTDLSKVNSSIEEEYKKTCEDLENALLNIRELETLLKGLSGDEAELQRIDEELNELEARKSQLEDINISLKTALDVLTEASKEIQKDFVPALNYKMADAVKRITAGKYHDLRADSGLALNVLTPETGDVVAVSSLSGGTIDQMYLALRLSVADMVSNTGEKLPFIMDEIFAQYDDDRTKETFQYLKELSEERQIIFFTCKGREIDIARQVFNNEINVIEI